MKSTYEVLFEGVLPVIAKIHVEAQNQWQASALAEQIANSQKASVKSAFQIETYPADFLTVEELSEITPVDPDCVTKIWKREEIEVLLGETTT